MLQAALLVGIPVGRGPHVQAWKHLQRSLDEFRIRINTVLLATAGLQEDH
jgi:hypothetical protein